MEVVLGRILGELEARKANESKVRFGNKAIKFSFPMPMPERPKFSLDPGMLET
jgi:hypothetical protein